MNAEANEPSNGEVKNPGAHGLDARINNQEDRPGPLPYLRRQTTSNVRRASSARTESSSRASYNPQASTDSLLLPRATGKDDEKEHDEPTLWYSAPLLFAIVPALGGVIFKSGSIFITDLALLVLAALYLNWCLVSPWVWYRSSQLVKVEPRNSAHTDDDTMDSGTTSKVDSLVGEEVANNAAEEIRPPPDDQRHAAANEAFDELRLHELTALALCFLGPLIGSYVLHVVRSQLSSMGDQLVSNLHLTLFVLGAEIRPLRHAMKMAEARTMYLQRIVREDPYVSTKDQDQDATLSELRGRMDELESSYADKLTQQDLTPKPRQPDNAETIKRVQTSMQGQIDALNRAVRRYEKRETSYTMQTEARFHDLDRRLKEAVSLAAAAAQYSQRPGIVMLALEWVAGTLAVPLRAAHTAVVWPFQLLGGLVITLALKLGIVQTASRRSAPKPPLRQKTSMVRRNKDK